LPCDGAQQALRVLCQRYLNARIDVAQHRCRTKGLFVAKTAALGSACFEMHLRPTGVDDEGASVTAGDRLHLVALANRRDEPLLECGARLDLANQISQARHNEMVMPAA
jgi:hypothetical protein